MFNPTQRPVLRAVFYAFVGVAISIGTATAQPLRPQTESPRIVFLHLRAINDGFELIDSKSAPGLLRVPHYDSKKEGLHFELATSDHRVLFQDVCPDPTVRRLEYEDPDHPGQIIAKQVSTGNTEFTIRVPFFSEAQILRFYRPLPTPPGVTPVKPHPKLGLAGEVALPSLPSLIK